MSVNFAGIQDVAESLCSAHFFRRLRGGVVVRGEAEVVEDEDEDGVGVEVEDMEDIRVGSLFILRFSSAFCTHIRVCKLSRRDPLYGNTETGQRGEMQAGRAAALMR